MSTLSNLRARGWIATDVFYTYPCDTCRADSVFVRLNAPDCTVWALAGVGGAHGDVYGIYCNTHSEGGN